jgi:putative ABC transport system permease protein
MIRKPLRRVRGYIALAARRLYTRGTRTATRRTAATVAGVAVAIALLVIATGLAVGLATQTTIYGENVDYWIVPEGDGDTSALVAVDGPQFGEAHATTARIESIDGVTYATPVLSTVRYVEGPKDGANVLFIGIIPREDMGRVAGVSPEGLPVSESVEDPTREWHGDAILSSSAAVQLGVAPDAVGGGTEDANTIQTDGQTFHVRRIEQTSAAADLPIALVQLTDLQQLTGGAEFDTADQYLVSTTDPGIRSELEAIHPRSSVNTRADLTATQIVETDAALAIGVGAFLITFVVGSLFVVMTAGLELTTDAATVAMLAAIGVSRRSQLTLAGMQTLLMTVLGGIIGAGLGLGGLYAINAIVSRTVLSVPIASTHLALAGYGVLAAVGIGLITLPYVRYLIGRIGAEEVMR